MNHSPVACLISQRIRGVGQKGQYQINILSVVLILFPSIQEAQSSHLDHLCGGLSFSEVGAKIVKEGLSAP